MRSIIIPLALSSDCRPSYAVVYTRRSLSRADFLTPPAATRALFYVYLARGGHHHLLPSLTRIEVCANSRHYVRTARRILREFTQLKEQRALSAVQLLDVKARRCVEKTNEKPLVLLYVLVCGRCLAPLLASWVFGFVCSRNRA